MHEQFVALATRLIAANGRPMALVSHAHTGPVYDPDRAEIVTSITGVQSRYNALEIDGELVKRGDIKILIDSSVKPTIDARLRDGATDYSIIDVEELQPGDTSILYKVQARI